MRALLDRALGEGWSDAVEREVDDYENYLSTQLERLEDLDPVHLGDGESTQRLMEGLDRLLSAVGKLREAAEQGVLEAQALSLRAAVDAASTHFGTAPNLTEPG